MKKQKCTYPINPSTTNQLKGRLGNEKYFESKLIPHDNPKTYINNPYKKISW